MECSLKNITIHYEERGEGQPVLMLHGLPLDHRHMLSEMEPMFEHRTGWKRLYPDLPGMGQTAGPNWITSQDQMLDVVLDFMDHVAPGQRFVVAGLSYGGYLVQGVIHRRASMIDGALMSVPAVSMEYAQRVLPPRVTLVKDEALLAELEAPIRDGIEGIVVVQSRRLTERWKANIYAAIQVADHDFIERAGLRKNFSFDAELAATKFDRPTLIVTGRQDDACGYRRAWDLLENYPRATFAVLDSAGHCLPMEQETLYTALVNEWLDRIERDVPH